MTAPVGSYPAGESPYGALDMAGNVWEWVNDWYDEDYYGKSPDKNPQGPSSGRSRVLRGGGFFDVAARVRAVYRDGILPVSRLAALGFRCAAGAP